MEESKVYNAMRALEMKEDDGTETFGEEQRDTIVETLIDCLTDEWEETKKANQTNYILDALQRVTTNGTKLISAGPNRELLKAKLVKLL